jgi:hypothetical protein
VGPVPVTNLRHIPPATEEKILLSSLYKGAKILMDLLLAIADFFVDLETGFDGVKVVVQKA